jgi:hypothetical protein
MRPGRVATNTFIPPDAINMPGYGLMASPTLYPGEVVSAEVEADAGNGQPFSVRLYLNAYGTDDKPRRIAGPSVHLAPGSHTELRWRIPPTNRLPIFGIGLEVDAPGTVYLDSLTWDEAAAAEFGQPEGTRSLLWRKAWVNGVDHWEWWSGEPFRLVKNEGRGLAITGTRSWQNYRFAAVVRPAFLAEAGGIAVHVQGMQRFYALWVRRGCVQLVKALDGTRVLAEQPMDFALYQEIPLSLQATVQTLADGRSAVRLVATIDGADVFTRIDEDQPLTGGAVAFVVEEAHILADHARVAPAAA